MAMVDAAVARVLKAKEKYATLHEAEYIPYENFVDDAQEMMNHGVTRVDTMNVSLPIITGDTYFVGCNAFRTALVSNLEESKKSFPFEMAKRFEAHYIITLPNPSKKDIDGILEKIKGTQTVVVNTYNGHLNMGQIDLVNAICDTGVKVIALAMRNPYDLPLIDDRAYKLAVFDYTNLSFNTIEKILKTGEVNRNLIV